MPRQAGEAEGLPRLSPELQPWVEVEAEGVPWLLQGIAGQQTASQVVLEARTLRHYHLVGSFRPTLKKSYLIC